jgi:hypothetical protein
MHVRTWEGALAPHPVRALLCPDSPQHHQSRTPHEGLPFAEPPPQPPSGTPTRPAAPSARVVTAAQRGRLAAWRVPQFAGSTRCAVPLLRPQRYCCRKAASICPCSPTVQPACFSEARVARRPQGGSSLLSVVTPGARKLTAGGSHTPSRWHPPSPEHTQKCARASLAQHARTGMGPFHCCFMRRGSPAWISHGPATPGSATTCAILTPGASPLDGHARTLRALGMPGLHLSECCGCVTRHDEAPIARCTQGTHAHSGVGGTTAPITSHTCCILRMGVPSTSLRPCMQPEYPAALVAAHRCKPPHACMLVLCVF